MFDLGIQELVVIFVVALLVFGPKRLPELARTMGKGIGQLRKAMFEIKSEVESEMEHAEGAEGQVRHDVPSWKQEKPLSEEDNTAGTAEETDADGRRQDAEPSQTAPPGEKEDPYPPEPLESGGQQ